MQPTLYVPITSPPTPAPSPSPHNQHTCMPNSALLSLSHPNVDQASRRHILYILLHSLSPSDLLFVSQTIAPLLKRDFLSDLPSELALYVLTFITEPVTLCRAMCVSRRWYAIVRDDSVWKRLSCSFGFGGAEGGGYQERNHELIAPPLAVSISNSSTSSSASSSSKPFSWRRHFKTSYIIRMSHP
jgi:F-box and WD-40 domain protein CDC4